MARAPRVTWQGLDDAIDAGHGNGHGEYYKSMLEIKRWNPSPISVQVRKALPPYARVCNFFSRSEWLLALIFAWLGALIREQFPLWPWSHPHPGYGLNDDCDKDLPWSIGMEAICKSIGIKHGTFPGTRITYIWTIDLALTIPWAKGPVPGCCLVSVKPLESERYLYVDPLDRGPEKLEGERQYAIAMNLPYFIGDRSLYPGSLLGQLEFLHGAAMLPESNRWWPTLQRFRDRHEPNLAAYPPAEWIRRLQMDFGATKPQADYLIQHCLWTQIIDADLSRYLDFNQCPKPGGRSLRAELRKSIWEDRP